MISFLGVECSFREILSKVTILEEINGLYTFLLFGV